jgi:hypothetical protein
VPFSKFSCQINVGGSGVGAAMGETAVVGAIGTGAAAADDMNAGTTSPLQATVAEAIAAITRFEFTHCSLVGRQSHMAQTCAM